MDRGIQFRQAFFRLLGLGSERIGSQLTAFSRRQKTNSCSLGTSSVADYSSKRITVLSAIVGRSLYCPVREVPRRLSVNL